MYSRYAQYIGLLEYVAWEFEKLAETDKNGDRLRFFAKHINAMCSDLLGEDEAKAPQIDTPLNADVATTNASTHKTTKSGP